MAVADLRPMNLGELLDRTFGLYRSHFVLFVGIMALPQLFAVAINLFVQGLTGPQLMFPSADASAAQPAINFAAIMGGMAVMGLVYWVVYAIALGATTFAVSEVFLGRHASIRGSYDRMKGRFWRLMDVVFSASLRVFGVFLLCILVIGAVIAATVAATAGAGSALSRIGVAVGILAGYIVGIWLAIRFALRYSVSIPAALMEDLKARPAMKRSAELMKGNIGRAFLMILLFLMVTYSAIFLIQGPFLVATFLMGVDGVPPMWITSLSTVMGGVAGALVAPLMMIALVLLYYDVRMRREAFDLNYMLGALDGKAQPPPASPPPAVT